MQTIRRAGGTEAITAPYSWFDSSHLHQNNTPTAGISLGASPGLLFYQKGGERLGKLPPKQFLFVQEYIKDLNATQAAIRAGYTQKRASEMGYQLLQKPTVQAAIAEAQKNREIRTQITQDRVLKELAKIAFGDGTAYAKVVTKTDMDTLEDYQAVELTETDKLTADQRAAISGIKQGKHGIEVARYDKVRALELLGKHLGMFDKKEAPEEDTPDDGFLDALDKAGGDAWQA